MSSTSYSEAVQFGGTLNVFANEWYLEFYFPGPDRRYKGTYVRIFESQAESYATAYRENWKRFTELKRLLNSEGELCEIGARGMAIRVGGYFEGVCIDRYHLPLKQEADITQMVDCLTYCAARSREMQQVLQTPKSATSLLQAATDSAATTESSRPPQECARDTTQGNLDVNEGSALPAESTPIEVKRNRGMENASKAFLDSCTAMASDSTALVEGTLRFLHKDVPQQKKVVVLFMNELGHHVHTASQLLNCIDGSAEFSVRFFLS